MGVRKEEMSLGRYHPFIASLVSTIYLPANHSGYSSIEFVAVHPFLLSVECAKVVECFDTWTWIDPPMPRLTTLRGSQTCHLIASRHALRMQVCFAVNWTHL
jgi:hypothetical protein